VGGVVDAIEARCRVTVKHIPEQEDQQTQEPDQAAAATPAFPLAVPDTAGLSASEWCAASVSPLAVVAPF